MHIMQSNTYELQFINRPEMAEVNSQVKSLLEKDYIQPSNSPNSHPVLFAKTGGLCMCTDYRSLKAHCAKTTYPTPRIDDWFDQLQGAKVFSSIDLQSG